MLTLGLRRLRYRSRVSGTALAEVWDTALPGRGTDWREVPFMACDAEMSSLEVSDGELLSLGWVFIDGGGVQLDSARHHLIRAEKSVGQSATIHQLRDCELDEAEPESEVFLRFLEAASGRVLVFHNAVLDLSYLNRTCRQTCGAPLLMPCIDTMGLEHLRLRQKDSGIKHGELRLQACRDRYNLPAYPAHNALVDALATAELMIAQSLHRGGNKPFPLRYLLQS